MTMASIANCSSHNQRVNHIIIPLNHHFPMVFLWFSYGMSVSQYRRVGPRDVEHLLKPVPQRLQERSSPEASPATGHRRVCVVLSLWNMNKNQVVHLKLSAKPGACYIPSGNLISLWKTIIFSGKIHYQWPFSIAMLNYQRVRANQVTINRLNG